MPSPRKYDLVLFGATGYTINHEDWFGATHPVVVEFQGSIAKDPVTKGDRLAVVEQLRANYRITGAVTAMLLLAALPSLRAADAWLTDLEAAKKAATLAYISAGLKPRHCVSCLG